MDDRRTEAKGGETPLPALIARLSDHCRSHRGAVVSLTGTVGAGQRQVLQMLVRSLMCDGAPAVLRECVSRRLGPDAPVRRFEALDGGAEASPAALLRRLVPQDGTGGSRVIAFVPHADLLDDDSLRLLDALVHSSAHTVVLASLQIPQRYLEILDSPRGLHAELPPLTPADAADIVARRTGAPPTPQALAYLLEQAGGMLGLFHAVVHVGRSEQWLQHRGDWTVIARSPLWLDRRWALRFHDRYAEVVTVAGLRLLERAALTGRAPLREAMEDPLRRAAAVRLEQAGIAHVSGGALRIRQPVVATAFELAGSSSPEAQDDWERAVAEDAPDRSPLMALASGIPVAPAELGRGAVLASGDGRLHQAYALLSPVMDPGPRTFFARATIEASAARPHRALDTLRAAAERAAAAGDRVSQAEAEAVAQFVVAASFRFEEIVFAPAPPVDESLLGPGSSGLYRAARVMRSFALALWAVHEPASAPWSAEGPADHPAYTGTALPPHQEPTTEAGAPAGESLPVSIGDRLMGGRSSELAYACELTAQACLAVLQDRSEDARALLAELAAVDWVRLPLLGVVWCRELQFFTRLLLEFDADPCTDRWLAEAPIGIRLQAAVPTDSLELVGGLVRGEPIAQLQEQLSMLWAKTDTELLKGTVTRGLMEMMDRAVPGTVSTGLSGPLGAELREGPLPAAYEAEPGLKIMAEFARLLHGPVDVLDAAHIFAGNSYGVLVRRMLVRTVIIRRAPELPPRICADLRRTAEHVGVEPEWLALAQACAAQDEIAYEEARAQAHRRHPRVHVAPWNGGSPTRDGAPETMFRHDRLSVLSPREQEIARALAEGRTTAEAAGLFGVSVRTVDTHIRSIYRKLDVHSRTELRAEIVL
ncbi:helix-turn-helix transcriptional regulator [Brevibacterium album]|uniref:helix-turn-helix transcriptional regulator n=1 Tax=Brevibacterium album TaxID=417948 RepID=UPI00048ECC36|nr:helix-turn-helix transcriptional regulator [Brevibacterium album]